MSRDVVDKDFGWAAMVRAAAKADGLELRNGILDWRKRYKRTKNAQGQQIAKVAGIHKMYGAIADGYEQERGTIDSGMVTLLKRIHAGVPNVGDVIYELMGRPIQVA
jgi:hypothetical protein